MSFSQPTLKNPALHFYEWRNGQLSYYDKEQQKSIPVKLPFSFIVLDELATITGYHEQSQSGFFSNEVKNTSKQTLNVRAFKAGQIAEGLYQDIKDAVKAKGGKYTRSVYIAEKLSGGWVISNIKFSGAAFSGWLDYGQTPGYVVENGRTTLTGSHEDTKGATKFQVPDFKWDHITPDETNACMKLDRDLQTYLAHYFIVESDDTSPGSDIDPNLGKATPEQLEDFERRKAAKAVAKDTDDGMSEEDVQRFFDDGTPLPEYQGD